MIAGADIQHSHRTFVSRSTSTKVHGNPCVHVCVCFLYHAVSFDDTCTQLSARDRGLFSNTPPPPCASDRTERCWRRGASCRRTRCATTSLARSGAAKSSSCRGKRAAERQHRCRDRHCTVSQYHSVIRVRGICAAMVLGGGSGGGWGGTHSLSKLMQCGWALTADDYLASRR